MAENLPFSYRIRRSHRVANARIVVKPGLVEVVAPLQIPEQHLHRFVAAKRQWISRALDKMAASRPEHSGFVPVTFKSGEKMTYQGHTYPLMLVPSKLKRIKIEFAEAYTVHVPESMASIQHQVQIRAALIRWLKKQTRQQVDFYVSQHAPRKQLVPRSITIKTQKSRWGSCGIRNDININWLLMMAPKEVLEYVVVHELCHIEVKNHSSQFWALVAEHLPDYQLRRNWLKKQGRGLMMAFSGQAD